MAAAAQYQTLFHSPAVNRQPLVIPTCEATSLPAALAPALGLPPATVRRFEEWMEHYSIAEDGQVP